MFGLFMEGASFGISFLISGVADKIKGNSWLVYPIGLAPIWAIGFPICLMLATNVPTKKPEDHEIKPKYMVQFYLMLVFLTMTANIGGSIIISIIESATGLTIENSTIEMIQKQQLLPTIVFAVIVGPILEELAYRKLLIDKLGQYNKRYAILLSGIMFGLFHTNLHQFFYTAVIGMIFAYIYTISGRIRYSIILHMTFNFVHGVLPMIMLKYMDLESLMSMADGKVTDPEVQRKVFEMMTNPAFAGLLLYSVILFGLWLAGLILWCINSSKIKVNDKASPLPIGEGRKVAFVNVGMILFAVLMVIITIVEIVELNR